MAVQHDGFLSQGHVVERGSITMTGFPGGLREGMVRLVTFLLALVTLAFPLVGGVEAVAAEDQQASEGGTISDQITDTQNLLGSDAGSVADAIKSTKEETGVSVRLLYLPSFYQKMKPEAWAKQVLRSMKPAPNTVLLAVASQDGKLVVAVSSNSDDWLKDQKTVDQLSQDALGPISKASNPDWVGSAKAMMDGISRIDKERKQHRRIIMIVLIAVVVVVLALGAAGLVWWLRQKNKKAGSTTDDAGDPDAGKEPENSSDRDSETGSGSGSGDDAGDKPGTETA